MVWMGRRNHLDSISSEFKLHPEMIYCKQLKTITYKGIALNEEEIENLNKLIKDVSQSKEN